MNDLSYNRLDYNRLVYNRLVHNRLVYNRLVYNRLVYNSLDGLETTQEGRDLLTYIARCALDDGDTLVATYDNVEYTFPGLLGLAPEWEDGGLSEDAARLVSACLIAHVNAYGVSVPISIRADGYVQASSQEQRDYSVYEATFFGDVFGDTLETYACLGGDPTMALAHSSFRAQRVCADDTPDCAIEAVGYCRDVCETHVPGYGWTDCWANNVRYSETMSTFLRYDSAVGSNVLCTSKDCKLSQSSTDAVLACDDVNKCDLKCEANALCTLEAVHVDNATVTVKGGADAQIDCLGSDTCFISCRGTGAECDIDCKDANSCGAICKDGAECAMDCTDSPSCGFLACDGPLIACPGDVWVCNGSCP